MIMNSDLAGLRHSRFDDIQLATMAIAFCESLIGLSKNVGAKEKKSCASSACR